MSRQSNSCFRSAMIQHTQSRESWLPINTLSRHIERESRYSLSMTWSLTNTLSNTYSTIKIIRIKLTVSAFKPLIPTLSLQLLRMKRLMANSRAAFRWWKSQLQKSEMKNSRSVWLIAETHQWLPLTGTFRNKTDQLVSDLKINIPKQLTYSGPKSSSVWTDLIQYYREEYP